MMDHYILTVSCVDKVGIVAAISGFLTENQGFILESQQFGDVTTGLFFMRTYFTTVGNPDLSLAGWKEKFLTVAAKFDMQWQLRSSAYRMRVAIMVSREGHCLNALLNKKAMGDLAIDIPVVISNHPNFEKLTNSYDTPFYCLPITPETKQAQEKQVIDIIADLNIDLIVLARYMQILSADFVRQYSGTIINIHHSFLPSFKGAKPYHQAFDRGVKLIGATAHYVSNELDEGPIIEQEITRVNHAASPEELMSLGQDIEVITLARAVKWHIQHRVFMNGNKTVVFN
jgi:formyltetrahydrofolate deformylase